MILQTPEVIAAREMRSRFRHKVNSQISNDGLSKEEYKALKGRMIASDMTVRQYIHLRHALGEVVWKDDKLVSTR